MAIYAFSCLLGFMMFKLCVFFTNNGKTLLELDLLNGMHNGFIPLSFSKVKYKI